MLPVSLTHTRSLSFSLFLFLSLFLSLSFSFSLFFFLSLSLSLSVYDSFLYRSEEVTRNYIVEAGERPEGYCFLAPGVDSGEWSS